MKRFFCLMLAIMVLISSFAMVQTSAQDVTNPDCIYFQVPTATGVAWKNFSIVFCHIWREGNEGGDFYPWQAKDERCTDLGNGYWSYDISGFEFDKDGTYAVIFSNENGMQTYNLTLTSACKGDIVVCNGDTCVNPVDSAKQCTVARWLDSGDSVFPCAQVGSDGGVVDPDGVFNTDIDRKWGESDGVSIAMPEVEIIVEETEAETIANVDENSSSAAPYTALFIVGGAVVVAVLAVVVLLVAKRRKKQDIIKF